ncbi:MAG: zinc-ribbon domain-containing protein, partial [Clostridia bacterium]|nr:zinc-ribbon domain-containing protein [Clostridia bacterium]
MSEKQYISENAQLMVEWDWEKNDELNFDPKTLTLGSHNKVWWKCSNGHEWQAEIKSRNLGKGCPYCSGRYAVRGENDLQTINPTLAKEWNYERNNGLTPMDVLPNSGKKVWWKCSEGHEWETNVYHRTNGNGCQYCSGREVLKGYNDLQTVNPTLAKEW